ncbi:hypothetical protein LCGC14_0511950 [marine sediment metagenome]|uniref:Glycosyl transferase family 1 domain-containing protein n=1 Tax=marine sediment metagenome TaxID=412755 RepID=A0A0F9S5Q9_9ZZZZ
MKLWLRIKNLEFSSWFIVWRELLKSFEQIPEVEVWKQGPRSFPHPDTKDWIEMWWGDPEFWEWSQYEVKLRIGLCLSEHQSFFTDNPSTMIQNINQCDFLLCPSYAAMQAYLEAPIEIPIYLMPFGVDEAEFRYYSRDFEEDTFKFLHLGVTQFRKGSWLIIDAWLKAFKKEEPVSLTIATSKNTPMFSQLQKEFGEHPQITFTKRKVASSTEHYYQHHVLISPHLAEGFALCIPEAMATGMPCIVSRCSAPREYFQKEFGWWIEMSELYSPVNQCKSGISGLWRLPDADSLAEKMRYAYEHRRECLEKGQVASDFVLANLTWAHSANKALEIIKGQLK